MGHEIASLSQGISVIFRARSTGRNWDYSFDRLRNRHSKRLSMHAWIVACLILAKLQGGTNNKAKFDFSELKKQWVNSVFEKLVFSGRSLCPSLSQVETTLS